jgi:hypothetical protein
MIRDVAARRWRGIGGNDMHDARATQCLGYRSGIP